MFNLFKKRKSSWPFDQLESCASFTIKQIMDKTLPILIVYHDAEDLDWQFLNHADLKMEDALSVITIHAAPKEICQTSGIVQILRHPIGAKQHNTIFGYQSCPGIKTSSL